MPLRLTFVFLLLSAGEAVASDVKGLVDYWSSKGLGKTKVLFIALFSNFSLISCLNSSNTFSIFSLIYLGF